jgi:tetratricopeptide (TPR) repeat protein
VNEKSTVGTCQYCGSTMTLPKDSDEKKANLFNRANHYRRNNDFDKAMVTYENILNEDNNDAEAHWGVVLCKYGIEYVEDPKTNKRIPTCHRAQYGSVLADEDYKQALANADDQAKLIYAQEAKAIEGIQKQILEISAKEEPFDVFICYKETSETGSRTKDSVIAQDIYYHLTEAGYKVFFSRITLEDKLGTAYEPYIFAALNSSKVMVVVGTKPEHFNATWTKNEWSRYLGMIIGGAKKVLIPAYRDMDAYELPEEFSHLQAQDMSRLGFIQDLSRGIQKVLQSQEERKQKVEPAISGNLSTAPGITTLIERAFICLEDGEFDKANDLLESVLNLDPRNVQAYIGKLLVEFKIRKVENILDLRKPIDTSVQFQKILRFADSSVQAEYLSKAKFITSKIEEEKVENIYSTAMVVAIKNPKDLPEISKAIDAFISLGDYKDSQKQATDLKGIADKLKVKEEKRNNLFLKFSLIFILIFFLAIVGNTWLPRLIGNKIEYYAGGNVGDVKIYYGVNSSSIESDSPLGLPFSKTIYHIGSVDGLKIQIKPFRSWGSTLDNYSCDIFLNGTLVVKQSNMSKAPFECTWSRLGGKK